MKEAQGLPLSPMADHHSPSTAASAFTAPGPLCRPAQSMGPSRQSQTNRYLLKSQTERRNSSHAGIHTELSGYQSPKADRIKYRRNECHIKANLQISYRKTPIKWTQRAERGKTASRITPSHCHSCGQISEHERSLQQFPRGPTV